MVMKSVEAFVFLPRVFTPNTKVNITDSDGAVTDVTKYITGGQFTKAIFRIGIGSFGFRMTNREAENSGKWKGGDVVEFYADMSDATTKKFKGRIDIVREVVTRRGSFLEIEGRHIAYPATESWVFKTFSAESNDTIVKETADDFLSGFTYANVDLFTNTLTKDWGGNKNVIDCFREVCMDGNADGYIDDDNDIHLFAENSVLNTDDAAAKQNTISLTFGKDTYYEKNKITVYSKDEEGMDIIYTSGTGSRVFPPIIDFSIKTRAQAKEVADAVIAQAANTPEEGTVLTRGLLTIEPGENMWISVPKHQIHGIYKVVEVIHLIGSENKTRWSTLCRIERPSRGTEFILSQRVRKEFEIAKINNPYNMEFSYNFTFDDDTNIASHSATETREGYLATDGASAGTMTTAADTATNNITKLQLKYRGENNENTIFEVSVDGGSNYETITKDQLIDPFPHSGKKLKIKVAFASAAAKVYSLKVDYK